MKNLAGNIRGFKNAVPQMKGPGMNLGMKKPRKNTFIAKPKPYKQSPDMKAALSVGGVSSAKPGGTGSYLPSFKAGGSVGKSKPKSRSK